MRGYGVIGIVALSAMAYADAPKDVGAAVAKVVRASARDKAPDVSAVLTKKPVIMTADGGASAALPHSRELFGADSGEAQLEPGTPTIVVGDHYAWFHVVVDASYVLELMNSDGPNRKRDHVALRVSGVAVDDHGWKIAAMMFSNVISDKQLYAGAQPDSKRPDSVDPRATSPAADALAHWIYEGTLASHIGKNAIANGTAPAEVAAGAAAPKLAHAWDGLKMWTSGLEATTLAGGAVAFVQGTVFLPRPHGAVQLAIGAVLVHGDDGWRWVCLNFAPLLGA